MLPTALCCHSDCMQHAVLHRTCMQVCRPLNVSGYDSPADCLSYMASIPRVDPYGGQVSGTAVVRSLKPANICVMCVACAPHDCG